MSYDDYAHINARELLGSKFALTEPVRFPKIVPVEFKGRNIGVAHMVSDDALPWDPTFIYIPDDDEAAAAYIANGLHLPAFEALESSAYKYRLTKITLIWNLSKKESPL